MKYAFIITLLLSTLSGFGYAQESTYARIYVIPIEGMVDNGMKHLVERGLKDAKNAGAAGVILHVDTFGGLLDAADEIRTDILDFDRPIIAFIDKNAASAGALISIAADSIFMAPGSSMGAATVVEGQTGNKASEKMQSYMKGLMRSTAEATGRDPRIAEAMVDESIAIEGIIDEGKLLTLSTSEALKLGFIEASLSDMEQVQERMGWENAELFNVKEQWTESVLRFLSNPVVSSLLMLMMMGGMYFELQSPGLGFPGAIAGVGAALFFAPLYIMGLAESWEIVLFIVGILLILVEVFVIPGFGVAGFLGITLTVFSLGAALIGNIGLSFPETGAISRAIWTMVITLLLGIAFLVSMTRYLPRNQSFNRLVLQTISSEGSGNHDGLERRKALVGLQALTVTTLRPSGTILVGNDKIDVVSDGEFIDKNEPVIIVSAIGNRVVVRKENTHA